MNSAGAIIISPIIGLLLISPILYLNGELVFSVSAALLFIAITITAIIGRPIHDLIIKKTKAKYWQYALVGAAIGSALGAFAGLFGVVIGLLWGAATTVSFRWLAKNEITETKNT